MKKSLCLILLLFMSTGLAFGSPTVSVVADGEESKLLYASAQHEIISILLQEERFDSVLPELEKILALNLRGESEKLIVKEVWIICDQLVGAGKFDLAHQIIDATLPKLLDPVNQFTLNMRKGQIYRAQGLLKEALELYRLAQELQK